MPSIVAELGAVVEQHMKAIGLLHDPEMSPEQRALIAEKRAAYESRLKKNRDVIEAPDAEPAFSNDMAGPGGESARKESAEASAFPPGATMCGKCSTSAVILMDGCATCLNCGYSKCG
jgi:hypothetical protein